jgi:hypothetical protein
MKHLRFKSKTKLEKELVKRRGIKLILFNLSWIGFNTWLFNLKTLFNFNRNKEFIKEFNSNNEVDQSERRRLSNNAKINWNLITKPLKKKKLVEVRNKSLKSRKNNQQ